MTDEELMIINCVMYDPTLVLHDGQTLGDWAKSFDPNMVDDYLANGQTPPGLIDKDMWENIVSTILNDANLKNVVIKNVEERPVDPVKQTHGNDATFLYTDPDKGKTTAVIAYSGTSTSSEWADDGDGGHIDVTDTPQQKDANDYFVRQTTGHGDAVGADQVITTGHSKGGNFAQYVAIVNPKSPKPATPQHAQTRGTSAPS